MQPNSSTMAPASPASRADADWSGQLAVRLFAPPARWGWQAAAPVAASEPQLPAPPPRPVWSEPPNPDTTPLRAARSKAVSRLIWRVALTIVAVVAFTAYQLAIEAQVADLGGEAAEVYPVVLAVVAGLLAFSVLRALGGVRYAARNIRNFEQPYLAMRDMELQRHQEALRGWEDAVRQHSDSAAQLATAAAARAAGPLWYPVQPATEPTRIDVFGGDPHRNGWASLLVTLGTSAVCTGNRITVLDCTGQDVGGGLAGVARAAGMRTSRVDLDDTGSPVALLGGLANGDIPECLAYALTGGQAGGDPREERALVTGVLRRVIDSLDGSVTFARLTAGVTVLCQGTGDGQLSTDEVARLAGHIGDLDQNEWTLRRLRFLASKLWTMHGVAPGATAGIPLWTTDPVSLICTAGGRDDRKELLDRLLVQLAQQAMDDQRLGGDLLVVAGADHLGAERLTALSEHARQARVLLLLMIDQPQGDLEKIAGTGGAVCLMKMYNHRDASIAAELIGKGHRFVVNQVTRQVGKSFTDGGGDSFAANSGQGASNKQRLSGTPGRGVGLSDSRGHTWTGTRNWSASDNVSTSTATGRVYEFIVEPQEILGMPETAFILIDNTGPGRRVVLADGNPGICLLDRVATIPAR